MTELVLSNATSFFSGSLEKLFINAKKYGFKYVEIAPYRWSRPEQILELQKKYGVMVAGIHLPFTSWQKNMWQELKNRKGLWNKLWIIIFRFFMGNVAESPGLRMAELLKASQPYVLLHSDIAAEIGSKLTGLQKTFHVVIENIPTDNKLAKNGVFDHNHFLQSLELFPKLNAAEMYKEAQPEVIHISYDNLLPASFPNPSQQAELRSLLKLHQPKYITIETNPLSNVRQGKLLLEKILNPESTPI